MENHSPIFIRRLSLITLAQLNKTISQTVLLYPTAVHKADRLQGALLFFFLINLFLAALGLCCCTRAFSSMASGATLATLGYGAWASHCGGISCGARALGMDFNSCGAWTSVVVVCGRGLSICGADF